MIAIVPVNAPEQGKQRLASTFSLHDREALVRAMLADVVAACRAAPSVRAIQIVTPDATLAPPGCDVLLDAGLGHVHALGQALTETHHEAALVVMADCPLVTGDALEALAAAETAVAVAPAQDGGTNALLLRPPGVIEPAFGMHNGASIVADRAREAGVELRLIDDDRLALDLDTPEDARRIAELGAATATQRLLRCLLGSSAGVA